MSVLFRGGPQSQHSAKFRWLRRLAIASLAAGWLGVVMLALPLIVHAQASALASYGATASGWAIQPYVVNDEFINIPATDQTAPYTFVEIDQIPSADAKAAYFTPGTAINAALATNGASYQVPNGVEARYPGNGSASTQTNVFNDGVATQAAAGTQSVQAAEAYAQAAASVASYQFAPPPGVVPSGGLPPLPAVPPLPTVPVAPTQPGGGPTPTPSPNPPPSGGNATPTPTPCLIVICPTPLAGQSGQPRYILAAARTPSPPAIHLPDVIEQQLATALRAAELANPALLSLAGGHTAATDLTLPYAQADVAGQAVAQAADSGVQVTVATHAGHVELFQGLIEFSAIDSRLQGLAPATRDQGQGAIRTIITGATIAGIPVTIDQGGVQVTGQGGTQSSQVLQALSAALNGALKAAGVQIALVQTMTTHDVGKWQGAGAGVQVTAEFNPASGKVPATHVNFTLGQVTASLYAIGGGSLATDVGGCPDCGGGFFDNFFGAPASSSTPGHSGSGLFSLPGSLSTGELLTLLFVVQGFSTAAVAATASNAEQVAKALQPLVEEESR